MLTALGETKRQVEAAMSKDFVPEVALREGGRVNTLGTRLMRAGVRRDDKEPVLSPDDLQYLFGPEGEEAMIRLAKGGRDTLYLTFGEQLKVASGLSYVVVEKKMNVRELRMEAWRRERFLAIPSDVKDSLPALRSAVRGHFWIRYEEGGEDLLRADCEEGMIRDFALKGDIIITRETLFQSI